MQRQKCDLLHRKNIAFKISEEGSRISPVSNLESSSDGKGTLNILHADRSDEINERTTSSVERKNDDSLTDRLKDNVKNLLMTKTDFADDSSSKCTDEVKQDSIAKKEDSQVFKTEPKESKEDKFVNALTRLQRLNTDLANERNLLAWARTALASARTFLAFIGVAAVTEFGKASRQVCYLGFSVMSVYIILQGTERYNKIKRIVYLKDPPPNFDRLTNAPLPICLAILFLLGLMSISFDQWED